MGFLADQKLEAGLELSMEERRLLRDEVANILVVSHDPEALLEALINAAESLRGSRAMAEECTLASRRRNLKAYITWCRRPPLDRIRAVAQLSVVNRLDLGKLARSPAMSGVSELERVMALKAILDRRRAGRGDRPHDELDLAGLLVRDAYERHTGKTASSTKEGNFVALLNAVVEVATLKRRRDMHRVAERVLAKGEIRQEGPGVTTVILPRFAD